MEIVFVNARVRKFFELTKEGVGPRVAKSFDLLLTHKHNLKMPFSKPLGSGLFELRIVGRDHVRFIYTFFVDKIYILHGFFKKTNQITDRDLKYARKQFQLLK